MSLIISTRRSPYESFRALRYLKTLLCSLVIIVVSGPVDGAMIPKSTVEAFGRLCRVNRRDYVDLRYLGFLAQPSVKPFTPGPVPPEVEIEPEQDPCSSSRIRVSGVNWSKIVLSDIQYEGTDRASAEPLLVRGTVSGAVLRAVSIEDQTSIRSIRSDQLDISVDGRFRSSVTFGRNWLSACSADLGAFEPAGPSESFSAVVARDTTARVRRLVSGSLELVSGLGIDDQAVAEWKMQTGGEYCQVEAPRAFSLSEFKTLRLPKGVQVKEWFDGGTRYAVVYGATLNQSSVRRIQQRFGSAAIIDVQLRTVPQ